MVGSAESSKSPVTSGIPQGSVLGPMLFVIYINDLPEVVDKNSYVYLFADDTKVFRQIKSHEDRDLLQKDIDNLKIWSDIWLLIFHPDKCVSMTVQTTDVTNQYDYHMGDQILSNSACDQDIGVFLDKKLKFDKHFNHVVNQANKILAVARRTFECMDEEIFCLILKGLVHPHIEYAAPVWSPHHDKYINLIETCKDGRQKWSRDSCKEL